MKMSKVKSYKEKYDIPYENRAELRIDTEQLPDLKDLPSSGKVKMIIEGEITGYRKDTVEKGKMRESYTI